MKNLFYTFLFTTLTFNAFARDQFETKTIELKNESHQISIDLNSKTVRCSDLGYGNVQLKISVLPLEYISFFDHSNRGEAEPCMTAGMMSCLQDPFGNGPSGDETSMLDRFRALGLVKTQLQRVLSEKITLNHTQRTCHRRLEETVETDVDGVLFTHFRSGDLGEYPYEVCLEL